MSNEPIDVYIDAFRDLLKQGMIHAEAIKEFTKEQVSDTINAELERGDSVHVFNYETCEVENACGQETFFDLVILARHQERQIKDFENEALPLMLAGWTSEDPSPSNSKDPWRQTQVMSLYWRAPSKRPGNPGRRYLSTTQAFNAMKRQSANS